MVKGKLILICQSGGEFVNDVDGNLSYKGGEANAVNINQDTPYDDLKIKLAELCNLELTTVSIKYFLPKNRKTLINLRSEKDFKRMVEFHANSVTAEIFVSGKEGFDHDALNTYNERIVESVGEGVTEFVEGDHVLTLFTGECRSCRHCTSGKSNICQILGLKRDGVMHGDQKTRFSIKGKPVYHYCAVSSFSEYTIVHSGCAVKVSPIAPLDKICLLSCGAAAGLGAAWKVANVSEGSKVVIFGLGTVGLSVAQGAKMRGASQIIGVDMRQEKCEKAKSFGVTDFLNPNDSDEPIPQVINRLTGGGADYAFECIGDTGMVTTALQSCCDGWGLTVTLGVPKQKPEVTAHFGLLLNGRTLTGSLFGGWKPKSEIPSLVEMYLKKEIELDDLITHNLPFEDINTAFDLMKNGTCLRCVIHMPEIEGFPMAGN